MSAPDDLMWPEFAPLWVDLRKAGQSFLVAGGYGLLLKQQWLRSRSDVPIVVPLDRWQDVNPRVTKDLDIVVGLELIASEASQATIAESLKRHGFKVTEKNPRWQFAKILSPERTMLVEFHARLPHPPETRLAADQIRVKHKPSLGAAGIHGRQNPEALGCEVHPFRFQLEGVEISVPNPPAWCIMKLAAMRDRWNRSEALEGDPEFRAFHRQQAIKHALDISRIVALMTREERDSASEVVNALGAESIFRDAASICAKFFAPATGWGSRVIARTWQNEDVELMLGLLASWFQPSA